jgi:esterase/lipase superfamily enzyme
MPGLASTLPWIASAVFAGCLYAAIWYVTRELHGRARLLARTTPLAVIVPGLLLVSLVLSAQRDDAGSVPAAPPTGLGKAAGPVRATGPAETTVGANTDATAQAPGVPPAGRGEWDIVPVFYGTDRMRQGGSQGLRRVAYGSERARRLELGRALVTVPAAHRVPSIERPFAVRVPYVRLVLYDQGEDQGRHFTIKELQVLPHERFLTLVRERLGLSRTFKDQAVVFVHGFNTAFDHALYRTAQIAYDLRFDGAAFLYSWPSGGGVIGYTHDRESATQAEPFLKEFLTLVLAETGAKSVSVIAHSLGNLPLLGVLRELGPSLPAGVRLNEVILAAPDVDRDVFSNLVAGLTRYGRGVTLYCSANDRAMSVSRQFAGGVPRAGDVPADGPVIVPGIDTIDVTATSTDFLALNHSTYAERGALLNDIGLLLQTGERPPEHRVPILQKVRTARGPFWRYP